MWIIFWKPECCFWFNCVALNKEMGKKNKVKSAWFLQLNHSLNISKQISSQMCPTSLRTNSWLQSHLVSAKLCKHVNFRANQIKQAQAWLSLQLACKPSQRSAAEPSPIPPPLQAREALPHLYLQMRISLLFLIGAWGGGCGRFTSGRWGGAVRQCTPADLRV